MQNTLMNINDEYRLRCENKLKCKRGGKKEGKKQLNNRQQSMYK